MAWQSMHAMMYKRGTTHTAAATEQLMMRRVRDDCRTARRRRESESVIRTRRARQHAVSRMRCCKKMQACASVKSSRNQCPPPGPAPLYTAPQPNPPSVATLAPAARAGVRLCKRPAAASKNEARACACACTRDASSGRARTSASRNLVRYVLSGSRYSSKPSVCIVHSRSSPLMVLRRSRRHLSLALQARREQQQQQPQCRAVKATAARAAGLLAPPAASGAQRVHTLRAAFARGWSCCCTCFTNLLLLQLLQQLAGRLSSAFHPGQRALAAAAHRACTAAAAALLPPCTLTRW